MEEAVCGGSAVSVVFVGLGIVADGRKGKKEEKRKEGEEKRRRGYIFQTFRNLRRGVSRGTVHKVTVVAHELRSRDFVNSSINSLVDCASESNRAHVIV